MPPRYARRWPVHGKIKTMAPGVIALLDKPNRSSFSMHAFVREDEHGTLHIHGLRNHPRSTLTVEELEQLVASQSVMRLPSAIAVDDLAGKVVGWLGRDFQEHLRRLDGPPVFFPSGLIETPDGDLWFQRPEWTHANMMLWIHEAAQEVFTGRSSHGRELAELMLWVLPDCDETRAAVWYTRPSQAERDRHLAWYARLERDAGHSVENAALERRFREILDKHQARDRGLAEPGHRPTADRLEKNHKASGRKG
jgi:hypothetical protein